MKKLLFVLTMFTLFACVSFDSPPDKPAAAPSITILSATPTQQGKYRGDLLTFKVDATGYQVYSMGILVKIGGEVNGGGGWGTSTVDEKFSHKVATASYFVGLVSGSLKKERVYTITMSFVADGTNEVKVITSAPYTIQK